MHVLLELIVGLVALLAAATLSPFGVDLQTPRGGDREVHRVSDCNERSSTATKVASSPDC